ncbi:hypothetical protein DP939_06475 [Spongiactinospora rosea]|uniref:Uncharacterized protein n=1 Tax=Spongiactinospora rosea TaxID=2248750 RepID=A0A366M5L1_9ACTN|nr:hypothetical protein DP939_06475 [Spongiactinospora rosea]
MRPLLAVWETEGDERGAGGASDSELAAETSMFDALETFPAGRGRVRYAHRRWITDGDQQARERITVLNLRHSLSTALLTTLTTPPPPNSSVMNVNGLLARHLPDTIGWTRTPAFTCLLEHP